MAQGRKPNKAYAIHRETSKTLAVTIAGHDDCVRTFYAFLLLPQPGKVCGKGFFDDCSELVVMLLAFLMHFKLLLLKRASILRTSWQLVFLIYYRLDFRLCRLLDLITQLSPTRDGRMRR
jgi:hypothetical protein